MPSFIFSRFVEAELEAIWDYIAVDNLDAADRFLTAANSTFRELAQNPETGVRRKFSGSRLDGVRSFRISGFENYLVFYQSGTGGIEILRVLHGARDLARFWTED
jgi:toxin ParE1/3/4